MVRQIFIVGSIISLSPSRIVAGVEAIDVAVRIFSGVLDEYDGLYGEYMK